MISFITSLTTVMNTHKFMPIPEVTGDKIALMLLDIGAHISIIPQSIIENAQQREVKTVSHCQTDIYQGL